MSLGLEKREWAVIGATALLVVLLYVAGGCDLEMVAYPSAKDHKDTAVDGVELEKKGVETLARIEMERTTDPTVKAKQAAHLADFTETAIETKGRIEDRKPSIVRIIEPYIATNEDGSPKLTLMELILGAMGLGGGGIYLGGKITANAKGKK